MSPLLPLWLACADEEPERARREDGPLRAEDYLRLEEGSAWVYRDDGEDGVPEEDALLRAQAVAEGVVELRRGTRWADAETVGSLRWDIGEEGGLRLRSWSLPGGLLGGGAGWPILPPEVVAGASVTVRGEDGWRCDITDTTAGIQTYYGTFEDVLIADCASGEGLEGLYFFGRGAGLIALEVGGRAEEPYGLELVAPW